mmetsp:Transcript_28623/g.73493  ORF Transcript_28623/g.73493 Transcript_28623/m.73493 type:complete len:115 (-) Transcript_28623:270-614(-)
MQMVKEFFWDEEWTLRRRTCIDLSSDGFWNSEACKAMDGATNGVALAVHATTKHAAERAMYTDFRWQMLREGFSATCPQCHNARRAQLRAPGGGLWRGQGPLDMISCSSSLGGG